MQERIPFGRVVALWKQLCTQARVGTGYVKFEMRAAKFDAALSPVPRSRPRLREAKWEKAPAARADVDVLAQKVQRKGKNTLGLSVAVSGFSDPAIRAHSDSGTGLIFMDGTDLFSVLEGVSLTEVLEAKRRHLSETGAPLLLVKDVLGG